MKRTKIVCTIGPASEKPEILEELLAARRRAKADLKVFFLTSF